MTYDIRRIAEFQKELFRTARIIEIEAYVARLESDLGKINHDCEHCTAMRSRFRQYIGIYRSLLKALAADDLEGTAHLLECRFAEAEDFPEFLESEVNS